MSEESDRVVRERVAEWLRGQGTDVAEVTKVAADSTDWAGDTGTGFRSEFYVHLNWVDSAGMPRFRTVEADEMESLWRAVVR